jgi:glycosyltransferase involved in cell wall biosynthesis
MTAADASEHHVCAEAARGVSRVALLAAFPFPLPQGSQVFVAEQARALARAGCDVTLLCYGEGAAAQGGGSPGSCGLAESAVRVVRAPRALSRAPLRAGPSWRKPLADAALLACWLRESRRGRFDVALAHNAEAAPVALAARPVTHVPAIYVAHTLLGVELSAYAPPRLAALADRVGARLDAALGRRCDGVLALAHSAAEALARDARGPVVTLPPGLDPTPPPGAFEVARACAAHGLRRGGFALYTGNLDRYQDLDDLAAAARRVTPLPIVVATHDRVRGAPAPLRLARLADGAEARALVHGAAVCVLSRRRVGGFPVKLLNYLEAGRPVVARAGVAEGLEHGRSAWLVAADAPPAALGEGVAQLVADPGLAERIGAGGRRVLEERHGWASLARATLAFASEVARR